MKERPLVSVIIPSYNHERYVEEAVRSVWNQTYRPIELIVVDDASQDRSVEILKRLEKESPIPMRVYVNEKNLGLPATLNRGLEKIAGEYVVILASDDRLPENRVEKHLALLQHREDCYGVYGDVLRIQHNGEPAERISYRPTGDVPTFWGYVLWRDKISVQTLTLKKEVFDAYGRFAEELDVEDLEFIGRLLMAGVRLCYCEGVSVYYRIGLSGLDQKHEKHVQNIRKTFHRLVIFNKRYGYHFQNRKLKAAERYRLYMRYSNMKSRWKAVFSLIQAIAYYPVEPFFWKAFFATAFRTHSAK